MLRRTLNEIFRVVPVGATLPLAATLLMVASGTAVAAPVPVVGPPFLSCASNNSGCFNGGSLSVQVTANTCINFYNGNIPDGCGTGGDTFKVNSPADTANFTLQGTGTIKDLIFATPPPITQFLTVPGPGGTVFFDLTGVIPSAQLPCNNPSGLIACSAGVFTLSQQDLNTSGANCPGGVGTCGQVLVGFGFTANGYLGTSATGTTPYQITFSTQFNNETIADLLAKAGQAGGITNAVSFTANPLAATPTTGGCPATKGFWKNADKHPFPSTLTFPVTIGGVAYRDCTSRGTFERHQYDDRICCRRLHAWATDVDRQRHPRGFQHRILRHLHGRYRTESGTEIVNRKHSNGGGHCPSPFYCPATLN
jgi:hypothetical protein